MASFQIQISQGQGSRASPKSGAIHLRLVEKSVKNWHSESVVRSGHANIRIRTLRGRVHGVRRSVLAPPIVERGAVDSLPGLSETRPQSHLHVQFADEAQAALHFRRQE